MEFTVEASTALVVGAEVRRLCDDAFRNYFKRSTGYLANGQFRVEMRWSRAKWDGYETLDVVSIGWVPHIEYDIPLDQKPKRSAKPIWDALEAYAKEKGRVLRVECILTQEFKNMLMTERGYTEQQGDPNCLLLLKA